MPIIVIPMSGLGTRFVESGYKDPKPLIIVDNSPIIEHVINLFDKKNDKYIFICNDLHLRETNMRQTLSNIVPKSKIFEVPVEGRKGPVHAVSLIFDNIPNDEEIIVSYCDYGTKWNYQNFLKDNRERNADGSIACYRDFHPHMLGTDNYAFLKETKLGSRWMDKIQEKKPFTDNRMEEYASNGTYYFKNGTIMKKYFQKLMDHGLTLKNEYYVSMVYNLLVEDGLKVNIFEIEKMLQWGTPYDLEIYNGWSKYFRNILHKQTDYIDKLETTTILPLAGHGSRFSKKGYTDPKPLIKVNNLPMVIQAIKCLPQSKNNVFIALKEHLNNYPLENKIKESYPNSLITKINEVTEGQACTTEIGIKESNIDPEKPILISACDNGVYYNVKKYQELVDDINNDIIVWSFRNEPTSKNNPDMYAWLDTDENDYVKSVSCKKFIEKIHNIKESHVIIGTMFFRKAKYFLDGLNKNYEENIKSNNEFYVDDVLNQNIKAGLNVKVFEVDNYICWGTPNDYETYIYWQDFFDKCSWHPYKKDLDITYSKDIPPKYFHIFKPNKYLFQDDFFLNNMLTPFYIIDSTKKYISLSTSRNLRKNGNIVSITEYFKLVHNWYNSQGYEYRLKNIEKFNKEINNRFNNVTYDINTNIFILSNIFINKYYKTKRQINYFHFFVDSLPRLYYYFTHPKKEKIKIFANINLYPDWLKSLMFDIFKFKEEDFIYTDKPFVNSKLSYVCDIIKFSESFELDFIVNKILKSVEKLSIKTEIPNVISLRKDTDSLGNNGRQFLNRKDVVSLLEKYDFIDYDSTSNLIEKINIFMKARIVVVENGAGITNLLFCSPETIVIILQSEHFCKVKDESLNIPGHPVYNDICKKFKNLYIVSTSKKNNEKPCFANMQKLEKVLSIIFPRALRQKQTLQDQTQLRAISGATFFLLVVFLTRSRANRTTGMHALRAVCVWCLGLFSAAIIFKSK